MIITEKDGLEYVEGDVGQVLEATRESQRGKQGQDNFYFGEAGMVLTTLPAR
jgi:hypothetical protein